MDRTNGISFGRKAANVILRFHKVFLVIFVVAFVFSVVAMDWVTTGDNMTAYLPSDMLGRESMKLEEEQFTEYGSAQVFGEHLLEAGAQQLAEQLASLDNVAYSTRDIYPSNDGQGTTAYIFLSFDSPVTSEESLATLEQVKNVISYYDGTCVYSPLEDDSGVITEEGLDTVLLITAIVAAVAVILASRSFVEIPILLLTLLFALVINRGTDFVFGTMSALTHGLAPILQLALTMGYAVMLSQSYWRERENADSREALCRALAGTAPRILTVGLITIGGLFALTFARFTIGSELGWALSKAVAASLLTVLLFLPCLLRLFSRLVETTRHRRWLPRGRRLGKLNYILRVAVPVLTLLAVIGAAAFPTRGSITFDRRSVTGRSISSNRAAYERMLEEGKENRVELIFPTGDYTKERALVDEISAYPGVNSVTALAGLRFGDGLYFTDKVDYRQIMTLTGLNEVSAKAGLAMYAARNGEYEIAMQDVSSYEAPFIDVLLYMHDNLRSSALQLTAEQIAGFEELYLYISRIRSELQGEDYSRIYVELDLPREGNTTADTIIRLHDCAERIYGGDTCIGGESVIALEFNETYTRDNTLISLIAVGLLLLILMIAFRSFAVPVLLAALVQGAVWITLAAASFWSNGVYFLLFFVTESLLLGAVADYAVVLTSGYVDSRKRYTNRQTAMQACLQYTLPTVLAAGVVTLTAGFLLYRYAGQDIVADFGHLLVGSAVATLLMSLLALPSTLLLFDKLLVRLSFDRLFGTTPEKKFNARRTAVGWMLITGGILGILAFATLWGNAGSIYQERMNGYRSDYVTAEQLFPVAEEFDGLSATLDSSTQDFASGLLTDQLGTSSREGGDEFAGDSQGQNGYASDSLLYGESLKLYEEGKTQYEQALTKYNADKAAYEEGMETYKAAQQQLSAVTDVYNTIIGPYDEMVAAQQIYDNAVAEEDENAAVYYEVLLQKQAALDKVIGSSGYSVSTLVAEYQATQHLQSEAKSKLDSLLITLQQSESALSEAQGALKAGEEALTRIGLKLENENGQLREDSEAFDSDASDTAGQQDADSEKLAQDIRQLAEVSELGEELTDSVRSMYSLDLIRQQIVSGSTAEQICIMIQELCREQLVLTKQTWNGMIGSMVALLVAAFLSLAMGITGLVRKRSKVQAYLNLCSGVFAVASLVLWVMYGVLWVRMVVIVCALIVLVSLITILFYRRNRSLIR